MKTSVGTVHEMKDVSICFINSKHPLKAGKWETIQLLLYFIFLAEGRYYWHCRHCSLLLTNQLLDTQFLWAAPNHTCDCLRWTMKGTVTQTSFFFGESIKIVNDQVLNVAYASKSAHHQGDLPWKKCGCTEDNEANAEQTNKFAKHWFIDWKLEPLPPFFTSGITCKLDQFNEYLPRMLVTLFWICKLRAQRRTAIFCLLEPCALPLLCLYFLCK